MEKLRIDIELDIEKGATTLSRPRTIQLRRGEESSTVIRARVVHDGEDCPLDGYTASFMAIMPGNLEVMDDACNVSGSVIEYEVPGIIISHRGRTDLAYFSLTRRDEAGAVETLTTQGFSINVNTGVDMSAAEYESYMPAISRIVEEAAASVRAAAASARLSERDLADYKERADGAVSDCLSASAAASAIASEAAGAEAARQEAERLRREEESARVGAEAERQALWIDIVQRSRGWLRHYCAEGEYDPETREPAVGEPDAGTIYFVPMEVAGTAVVYAKWIWDGKGSRWEALSVPEMDVAPVTPEQIAAIAAGESVSGGEVVTATAASALWAEAARRADGAYAAAKHRHRGSEIEEGTLPESAIDEEFAETIAGKAAVSHEHSADDVTSGVLPVSRGGTGVTSDKGIGLKAYPVGAVYFSYSPTSPASLFGGTWTQMTGRFVRMANDVSTGGADTHTLTTAQIPSHNHKDSYAARLAVMWSSTPSGTNNWLASGSTWIGTSSSLLSSTITGVNAGGSGAHNNMPAYQDLYAWRRTA